jgi:ferredoxin-NADP reductase/MOSC domain-containing protein YiiM
MATLVSVNVGLPRDVEWQGRVVHTGVWKETVAGPQMVRRLNIDGDGQGDLNGHGGEQRAVLVYQLDSYRFWADRLGRRDLVHGQFGENFTVDGLPDDEVCIGDRYRIGDALFEVTQPRVTCYRVGLRMQEPQMAALLVEHARPGFYLRVLEEGAVQAGDEIVQVASGPEAMTVAEIDALLYRPNHEREPLARALRIPALSAGWKASFQALFDSAGDGPAAGNPGLTAAATSPPPAWTGFRPLAVTTIEPESRTVSSFQFAAPDGTPLPPASPGQYLTLRLQTDTGRPPLLRTYSLSGTPGAADYRISVKREAHGAGSAYLHDEVRVGQTLDVAAPRGTFILRESDDPVALVSAGVGATPMLAMLHALAERRSSREVWWLYSARNRAEHAFADETRGLLARLPHARAEYWYSQPEPGDRLGEDFTIEGRVSAETLGRIALPSRAQVYLCGPQGFMDQVAADLAGLGVDATRIFTEPFGPRAAITPGVVGQATPPSPHPPPGAPGTGPAVSFARSDVTTSWDPKYASLLEFAEACAVPVQWSCRTGVCHTCETPLLSGSVGYSPEPLDAPGDGNALLCCSQPREDVVLDL